MTTQEANKILAQARKQAGKQDVIINDVAITYHKDSRVYIVLRNHNLNSYTAQQAREFLTTSI